MIRKHEHKDTETLVRIWLESNIQAHDFIPAEYWNKHVAYMRDAFNSADITVYETDGQAVGFAGTEGDYIAGIFVDAEHRSQGIGRQLINHLKRQHDRLTLHAYEKNRRAIRFYMREGFTPVARQTDTGTGETEITMAYSKDTDAS